jgi:Uma2 family endonuclease
MADPNIVTSGLSKVVLVEGLNLQIEIYRLEHQTEWTLEVVDEDGTSTRLG